MTQRPRPALTPIDAALELLQAGMRPLDGTETLDLQSACGRVLAEDCIASIAVPPHHSSAMDGFAVTAAAVQQVPVSLPVVQRIAAGQVGAALQPGQAARIFTGAPMPLHADAVVMQENCQFTADTVTVLQAVVSGENVRALGEDIAAGTLMFNSGHRLRAQDIGVLASLGISRVLVRRKCRVAVLATGNELVQPGTALQPGQIYNSNFHTLSALLQALACEVIDFGVVPDSLPATRQALLQAAAQADCIISTGGVSVGEEDHVKAALSELGSLQLWKLAIKPGKPLAYGSIPGGLISGGSIPGGLISGGSIPGGSIKGSIRDTHFFGLPGNPVSAFVTFCLVVRPCLLGLLGCAAVKPLTLHVPAGFALDRSGERQEYLRVTLQGTAQQPAVLQQLPNQSSGVGSSLSAAAGLAIIPPHTSVAPGDSLEFIPFSELVN